MLRLFIQDDPEQSKKVVRLFSSNTVWVSRTVILECEWVLKSALNHSRQTIHEMVDTLIHLENVVVDDYESIFQALQSYQNGMDFADALHLHSANQEQIPFYTFDKKLVKLADQAHASAKLL